MSGRIPLRRRLLISACAVTRITEFAAQKLGAARFLPALFALRYSNMAGLDRETFATQLAGIRSFEDARWCSYWDNLAEAHLDAAQGALENLTAHGNPELRGVMRETGAADTLELAALLAPAASLFADHGPQTSRQKIAKIARAEARDLRVEVAESAFIVLDEVVKAVTYFQVSSFPGGTPSRMRAYARSRQLTDFLVSVFNAGLDIRVEPFAVAVGGEVVRGYAALPESEAPAPAVLVTNGLEGTVQELLIPNLRYRERGIAMFVMEMPGTYNYRAPMSGESEAIYNAVIARIAEDPLVDETRIGMVGVSFGGYWSTRLAASNPLLRCAVSCGAPTHHSFGLAGSIGIPEIILHALANVTGARNPLSLSRRLRSLSLRDRYGDIRVPLLVINGDTDTLLSTRDSIELAERAPLGELKLYPDDDHCAMGHYEEWLDLCQQWLSRQLVGADVAR